VRSHFQHHRVAGRPASRRGHRRFYCESLEQRLLLSTASLVSDIAPGADSSFAPSDTAEVALGNKFIFAATDDTHGIEPWVSDGTTTSMLADINPGSGSSNPDSFVVGNGVVYFTANDGTSTQIWKTDGTPGGTTKVTNIPSTPDTSSGAVFTLFTGSTLYFTEDGDNQTSSLWATNGTPGAEQELTNFGGEQNSDPTLIEGYNGNLYFAADPAQNLWTSNGTVSGTTAVAATGFSPSGDFVTDDGAVLNGLFYFGAFGANGTQLWSSDGSAAGTSPVGNTVFNGSDLLQDFTVSGNTLYFLCSTATSGFQIFSTDGLTVDQVTSFANSNTGDIRDLTDVNGTLYFDASETSSTKTLYKLVNGTPVQVPLPSDGSGTGAGFLTNVNGTVFFNGLTASGTSTLFSSDGNTISVVTGDPGTDPMGLVNVNGTLFYSSDDPATGAEPHSAIPSTTPPPPPVSTPTVNITESASSINQGEKTRVVFTAVVTDGVGEEFAWNIKGSGPFISTGKTDHISPSYAKSDPGDYTIDVQVTTADKQVITGSTILTVKTVNPDVTVKAIPKHPTYNPLKAVTFRATWKHPGVDNTFTVLWTVTNLVTDEVVDSSTQSVGKARKSIIMEHFLAPALYGVTAQVTDNFGASGTEGATVNLSPIG
jgi:ELWxxDGT repeat protein